MTASILAQEDDLYDEFEDEDDTDDEDEYFDDYAGLNDTNLNGDGVRADAGTRRPFAVPTDSGAPGKRPDRLLQAWVDASRWPHWGS